LDTDRDRREQILCHRERKPSKTAPVQGVIQDGQNDYTMKKDRGKVGDGDLEASRLESAEETKL